MTNKQILVLNKIVDLCKSISGIGFVGLYPEGIKSVGQRYPAVVVMDGDEDNANYNAGQQVIYDYIVEVYLHHEIKIGVSRIADILDLQNKIITKVCSDLNVNGTAHNVKSHRVEKGLVQNMLTDNAPGYQGEIGVRKIVFVISIKDTRS